MVEEEDGQKEHNVKREKPMVRPEEIPPVPENRFLLRRDMPAQEESTNVYVCSVKFEEKTHRKAIRRQ